jgi:hypothetical protein
MTPQEAAALARLTKQVKGLTDAVEALTKSLVVASKNITESFRGFFEFPLPPVETLPNSVMESDDCTCGYDRVRYPKFGHHIVCPSLKDEHNPNDECMRSGLHQGHKDKE